VSERPLKICLVSSELTPLAKTGGLADVTAALAAYLHRAGHDVRVLIPEYSRIARLNLSIEPIRNLADFDIQLGGHSIPCGIDKTIVPRTSLPVYLLRCPALFDRAGIYTEDADESLRFLALTHGAFAMCQRMEFAPDIFHFHDWHTGLGPLYLKTLYSPDRLFERTRSVLTIHNIGYQGIFPDSIMGQLNLAGLEHRLHQDDLRDGRINFLKTGVLYADLVTTVSPGYAREIQSERYGMGLENLLRQRADSVVGILNGVDYDEWNPAADQLIPSRFSAADLHGKAACKAQLMEAMEIEADSTSPLIGIVSRLVSQKGVDLMMQVLPQLLPERDFSLVVLGSGEPRYEAFFDWLANQFEGRVGFFRGYNEKLAHWIEAGSDMFLMPSAYEPCGLNQMYSLKYGTVPIVRATGGLADSVEQIDPDRATGTGIVFEHYDDTGLLWAIRTALDFYADPPLWRTIMLNGMARDFSWERQGGRYVELFRQLAHAS
jgi:starch synthase